MTIEERIKAMKDAAEDLAYDAGQLAKELPPELAEYVKANIKSPFVRASDGLDGLEVGLETGDVNDALNERLGIRTRNGVPVEP